MTRPATTRLLLLAVAALSGAAAAAQPGAAPDVTWEKVPPPNNYGSPNFQVRGVEFLPGPLTGADTLLAIINDDLYRLDPEAATDPADYPWVEISEQAGTTVVVTDRGTLLYSTFNRPISRSADNGRTWERDVFRDMHADVLFQPSLPALRDDQGRLPVLAGYSVGVARSYGDGARDTWAWATPLNANGDLFEPPAAYGDIIGFGEVPPSPALPDGRLLAAIWNGVSYSDDGGVSWSPGAGAYGFARYIGHSFAFVPEPGHPYGGAVLAGVDDLEWGRDSTATVYRSEDGGATWTRAHRFSPAALGLANANKVVLAATPDGAVWAGVEHSLGGLSRHYPGAFARSVDGGRTWEPQSAGFGMHGTYELRVGRDGRLYAATVQGVWHTAGPAFATSGAPGPEPPAALAVTVAPNPTASGATVALSLAAPEAVRVEVVDVRGRVVAVAHDGPAVDGQRVALDTAGLAPGVYVVRAVSATAAASAVLAVAR